MNVLWLNVIPVRVLKLFIGALIFAGLVACGDTASEPAMSTSPLNSPLTSPITSPLATPADTNVDGHPENWPRFDGPYYSFSYPPGWSVEVGAIDALITLYPSQRADKVEMVYSSYEIAPEEDLFEWYTLYGITGSIELPDRAVLEERVDVQADGTTVRRLHLLNTRPYARSQVLLFTHGRLVLAFSTQGHDESATALLRSLANSIIFHADAPTTKAELFPGETDLVTTLDEVFALRQAPPNITPAPDLFSPHPTSTVLDYIVIFPLPLYPDAIITELGWILSRANVSTDCQDPERVAAFEQRIDELFSEFSNRTASTADAWYAPVLQFAESIVINP